MVAGLPKTRGRAADERAALDDVRPQLLALRAALEQAADQDTAAYSLVLAAYRLPRATDEEKEARRTAIADGLRAATEAPLETLRLAVEALDLGETVARHGVGSAASDVGVGASLLLAAAEGGAANVRINLEGLKDDAFREHASARTTELLAQATRALARVRTALADEPSPAAG
jgi:formiminotetrahydrofolate cyclodeaminase